MYNSRKAGEGFHTKGYIFKEEEVYRIIVGSSNMTMGAVKESVAVMNLQKRTFCLSGEFRKGSQRILIHRIIKGYFAIK